MILQSLPNFDKHKFQIKTCNIRVIGASELTNNVTPISRNNCIRSLLYKDPLVGVHSAQYAYLEHLHEAVSVCVVVYR